MTTNNFNSILMHLSHSVCSFQQQIVLVAIT